jgi:hypothetical protein
VRDNDDWPAEPVLASTGRLALRAEELPGHLSPAAVRLHREVRRRLRELELVLDQCREPHLATELRGATTSLHELLACHSPLGSTRCPTCRTRLGRAAAWPCHVWRITHALLVPRGG